MQSFSKDSQEVLTVLDRINENFLMPIELPPPTIMIGRFNSIVQDEIIKKSGTLSKSPIKCLLPLFFSLENDKWDVSMEPLSYTIDQWSSEVKQAGSVENLLTNYDKKKYSQERLTKVWIKAVNGSKLDCNFVLYAKSSCGYIEGSTNSERGLNSNIIRFVVGDDVRRTVLRDSVTINVADDDKISCLIEYLHLNAKNLCPNSIPKEFNKELITEILRPLSHHIVYLRENGYALYFIFAPAVAMYSKKVIDKKFSLGGLFVLVSGKENGSQLFHEDSLEETLFIGKCRAVINKLSSSLVTYYYRQLSLKTAIKSAIGSIMSRNGSHNIGSHVLAALSHNVGTMPDDRVLYQYIQHRMDYIATATTERPEWTMPTKFVSSMMRRFLSQRHLLDYVSRSEGLRAYQFQNPHEDTSVEECQPGTIRVHIRRINDGDALWNRRNGEHLILHEKPVECFIDYPKGEISHLDRDVDVAIPGGVVGQHAFFTILENILRNAAKHEWAVSLGEDNTIIKDGNGTSATVEKKSISSPCDIISQPGLVESQKTPTGTRMLFYGTPADVLNDTPFAVVGKTVSKVSQIIVDGEGRDANDKFKFTDYTDAKSAAVAGKVKLETVKDTPTGTYQVKLTATCSDGTKVDGNVLTFIIRQPHLDLYVDFQDRPRDGKVMVVVWSDCGGKSFVEETNYLSVSEVNERLEEEVSLGKLNLEDLSPLQRIQVKMARSLIATDGHLRRENWGLAEMRISAGYLNISKIEDIGGINKSETRFDIIRPVIVETNCSKDEQLGKRYCLGYCFSIPKPKELLVILPDSMIPQEEDPVRINSEIEKFSADLKRFGVELAFESTLNALPDSSTALPFSYVLFDGEPPVLNKLKLGRRLLDASGSSDGANAQYTGDLFNRNIHDILASNSELFAEELLKRVYIDWMNFVKRTYRNKDRDGIDSPNGSRINNADYPLVVDVYGQKDIGKNEKRSAAGAEQSLISDAELLEFVFRNSFNSAVDSYIERVNKRLANAEVLRGLKLWRSPGVREVEIESTRPEVGGDGVVVEGRFVQLTRSEMIRNQLEKWCERTYATASEQACMQTMRSWLKVLDGNPLDMSVPRDLKDFIDYLGRVIFNQAKAFLCKYEERIVTLPKAMEVKFADGVVSSCVFSEIQVGDQRVIFTSSDDCKNSSRCANAIAYWRHEDYKTERKNHPIYREALSGAQSYFSVFSELGLSVLGGNGRELNREDTGLVVKLVECGLLRLLIIDERVARFVAEHQDVKVAFSHIGIDVLDADSDKTIAMFKEQNSLALEELNKRYDIVIVHQGVIDKRLHDPGALSSVEEFCARMEYNVSCFAITTGRGTPSTIPPNARVLPFSVIESALFNRYPEKFILVDTVMNLLPIGIQEGQ